MELTEKLRQTFLLVVSILALVCFFSSFMLFSCAVYIKVKVDARMKLIETYNSNVLPAVFLFVGVINLAQNVICIFVCLKMRNIENREGLMRMMLPVLIGGAVLVVFEVSTAIASFVHISILEDEFAVGLKKAMSEYIIGKEMKAEMDTVQSAYGCCGDLDYTNWFEYSWLDPQYLKASTRGAKKYFSTDGKYYSDDTPYSCCDYHSPRPCIHHHIHANNKHHNYNFEVETTLYVRGCRIVLMEVYSRVLCTVAVIALLIATVKTSALLVFRLLQTSLVAAQEAGDWEATTPAYIYYLRPPDADLEQKKLLEGASDTDASANATGSDTDENTNNETDYDDDDDDEDDDNAGAASHSNINYSGQIRTRNVNDISHNKPLWQPLYFAPDSPGNGYFQDSNVRHFLRADDLAQQDAWGQPPREMQSESFVAESSNSIKSSHIGNEINDACHEHTYNGLPVSDMGPYKHLTEKNMFGSDQHVFPTQGLSDLGNGGIGSESGIASFPSDKCLVSTEAADKQLTVEPPKSGLRDDHQGFAGKLLARLTGALSSEKKFKDSSKSYKYSRVRAHSDSDEQEEEEDGEDTEDEEEEDEEESEEEKDICSSEEYDTNSGKETENKQYTSRNRGTVEEHESTGNCAIDKNSKTKDTKNHVSYQVQGKISETSAHVNKRHPTADNIIYSQNNYQRRLIDTRSGSDVTVASRRDAVSSSSRASLSSYHEVDEMSDEYRVKTQKQRNYRQRLQLETESSSASKNSSEITNDSSPGEEIIMSKSVSFLSPIVAASDAFAMNSQIRNRLHPSTSNGRLEHRSQDQAHHLGHASSAGWSNPNKIIRATNYLEQTDTQTHAADHTTHSVHWPRHNRLAELVGTHMSSETEYDAASNSSADDNTSHKRRFVGRYTPYPYDTISHVTINSHGYTPANITQSRQPTSYNTLQKLRTEISDIAELSNTDIPESDTEMSHLIPAVATSRLPDHLKRSQQQDERRQMHYTQAFGQHDFQLGNPPPQLTDGKKDKHSIVPNSSRGVSAAYCVQGHDEHANMPRVCTDYTNPKKDAPLEFKPAAKPFAFPLMQPSPSSFEISSSVRNHIRSYQRRSVFLASPLTHSRSNSPMNSSPQLALFSSPLLDSPMETSTPILCAKRVWDSYKCQTLSTTAHDHSNIQPSQETSKSDPVPTFDNSNYRTVNNASQRQASLPDLFPGMPAIDQQCLGAPQQLVAVESTLLIDEVYTSAEVCDVVHNVTTTEHSTRQDRVLISPFN